MVQSSSVALMMTAYQLSPSLSQSCLGHFIINFLLFVYCAVGCCEDYVLALDQKTILFSWFCSANNKRTDTLEFFSAISFILYTGPRLSRTRRWFSGIENLTG